LATNYFHITILIIAIAAMVQEMNQYSVPLQRY